MAVHPSGTKVGAKSHVHTAGATVKNVGHGNPQLELEKKLKHLMLKLFR